MKLNVGGFKPPERLVTSSATRWSCGRGNEAVLRGVLLGTPISGRRDPAGHVEEFGGGRRSPQVWQFVEQGLGLRFREAVPQEEPFPVGTLKGTAGLVLFASKPGGFSGEAGGVRCCGQGSLNLTEKVQKLSRTSDVSEAVQQTVAGGVHGEAATLGSLLDRPQFWNLSGALVEVGKGQVSLRIMSEHLECLWLWDSLINECPEQVRIGSFRVCEQGVRKGGQDEEVRQHGACMRTARKQ